ncbi:thiolase family protein [Sandarakinorhabdus sp. DWP1-3-1]|uniref:thiolase family protein n=1 Tax=Sandarakinorhabdus sp. DWP1-3-1 TaxID=2804627 RepID=UPI003CFBB2F5
MTSVHIVGGGIHPFGRTDGSTGLDQGVFAIRQALADAGLDWSQMEFGYGGSSAAGAADAVLPRLGLTGMQFINVNNGCATGGSSILSGYAAIKSGEFDIGIVVGFDKHPRGAFNADPEASGLPRWYGQTGMMLTTQFFGNKINRYMALNGISQTTLGLVAEKAFRNAEHTPHSWRKTPVSLDTIMQSQMVSDPLTKYMFCSPAEGGVALILASDRKMRELGLSGPKVRAAAIRTRPAGSFEVFAPALEIERGKSATQLASAAAWEMAGLGPDDVDVAQLQDTECGAEIMHMAENGFCADGEQEAMIANGDTRIGGRLPVNTDGGCLACGEPIGASGLRQIYENLEQLRGRANGRQVEDARIAYSQVYGAPGISGCVVLER